MSDLNALLPFAPGPQGSTRQPVEVMSTAAVDTADANASGP